MNFQAILDGIETEGSLQIHRIESEARKKIEGINREAERIAGQRRDRILFDGRARLNRERALIDQQASVEALQIHADARQKLIESVLNNVEESLEGIRKRRIYKEFLSMTVDEIAASLSPSLLEDQRIIMHFDKRDELTAGEILSGLEGPFDVKYDLQTFGGCSGESEDGRIVVLNTIESRFEHTGQIIQQILSVYFEEKASTVKNGSL